MPPSILKLSSTDLPASMSCCVCSGVIALKSCLILASSLVKVCQKLLALQPYKATGPDNVPSRFLKDFAHVLADPVTTIFNASLSSSVVPRIWKESNIIPIPKVEQPECEGDTRPISLTSCLSKLLEDFVVSWLIDDVKGKIDPC